MMLTVTMGHDDHDDAGDSSGDNPKPSQTVNPKP